jgi:sulfide dehydrogenase cytochrome subunit
MQIPSSPACRGGSRRGKPGFAADCAGSAAAESAPTLTLPRKPATGLASVLAVLALAGTAHAAPLEIPPGASSCSGCHAASPTVATPVPPLVGREPAEIVAAMQAFRSGQRPATVMDRIAKGFSDDEVAAIAAWYHAQPQ